MSSEKRYGVGIVGMDHWYAGIAAANDLRESKRGRVVAVAHRDEEKLREFAAERGIPHATTDYKAIAQMDEVDVIVTACTTAENPDIVVDAVKRGKHVISVKPCAMTLAEADKIVAAVREAGVLFYPGEALQRLRGASRLYKQWVGEGRIGSPISATAIQRGSLSGASMDWPGRRNDNTWWRNPKLVPGGGWLDHSIYHVDFFRWLLDDEPVRVSGVAKTLKHPELPKELEDFGVALVEFGKGLVATIEVTWSSPPGGSLSETHIVGSDGQIVIDSTLTGKVSVTGKFDSPTGSGWTTFSPPAPRGAHGPVEHVLECLATGQKPLAGVEDARANLATCLGFYEAARGGKVVSL